MVECFRLYSAKVATLVEIQLFPLKLPYRLTAGYDALNIMMVWFESTWGNCVFSLCGKVAACEAEEEGSNPQNTLKISSYSLIGRAPDYESEDLSSILSRSSERKFVYLQQMP